MVGHRVLQPLQPNTFITECQTLYSLESYACSTPSKLSVHYHAIHRDASLIGPCKKTLTRTWSSTVDWSTMMNPSGRESALQSPGPSPVYHAVNGRQRLIRLLVSLQYNARTQCKQASSVCSQSSHC